MELNIGTRLKHAWNAFTNRDPTYNYQTFGSGYSSLGMLAGISLDILKLDISFMKNIDVTDAVVESIIDLAHKLNLKTIAEGVETEKQYDTIKKLGCDYIQGYYFSKPLPKDEFEEYISNN